MHTLLTRSHVYTRGGGNLPVGVSPSNFRDPTLFVATGSGSRAEAVSFTSLSATACRPLSCRVDSASIFIVKPIITARSPLMHRGMTTLENDARMTLGDVGRRLDRTVTPPTWGAEMAAGERVPTAVCPAFGVLLYAWPRRGGLMWDVGSVIGAY